MKAWLKGVIAGVIIAVIGVAVLVLGLYLNGWKYNVPVNEDYEMRTFTAQNENDGLKLNVDAGMVVTEYTDGDRIVIEYPYFENYQLQITEAGGTVTLSYPEYHFKVSISGCNFSIPQTTVKLPRGIDFNLDVDMDAGTLNLADGSFGTISIDIDAGTVKAGEISCKTFFCDMDAGTLSFNKIDCTDFTCKLNAGTVKVNLLTANVSRVNVNAGTVKLGFDGGRGEYTVRTEVDAGTCKIDGGTAHDQNGTTDKYISVEVNAGTVKLNFAAD